MPLTLNTDNEKLINLPILNAKLAKMAWYNTFWAKLAGFQEITRTNGIRQTNPATNVIVQGLRDFVEQGRDNMLMYMLLPISEPGVYGDSWLKGTGEQMNMKYSQVFINQWRKAATKMSGRMNYQRIKVLNLMEEVQPALSEWWSKTYNGAFFQTIYEGVSPNLSAGTKDNGLGMVRRAHPNQYYHSADGVLTAVGTAKNTKTATELTTALASSPKKASAKMLAELRIVLSTELLIEPIVHNGGEFWLMLVAPDVLKQLKQDSTIISAQNSAFMGQLASFPAFQGRDFVYYDGICAVEERIGVRNVPINTTFGSLDTFFGLLYDKGYFLPPARFTDSSKAYANIVLGRDALAYGIAQDLEYTVEVDDHENVIEIGSQGIMGVNRLEYFNDSVMSTVYARGNVNPAEYNVSTPVINQSSAIIYTGNA